MSPHTPRTLVTVPATARKGESVTIRALAQHPMENGFRRNELGELIARDMINLFVCEFNGVEVFKVDWVGGIAANPLIQFQMTMTESGTFVMKWSGDDGYQATAQAKIEVT
jgi:sulfur-oxidizing protein SoxZ